VVTTGFVPSTSQACRLMEQGGIRLNNEKLTNTKATVRVGGSYLFQIGKRVFVEISLAKKTD